MWWDNESLIKFENPCAILIAAPSNTGKSYLTMKILQNADGMFKEPPSKILYCYNTWQSKLFDDTHKIEFYKGLPSESEMNEFCENKKHKIIVFDDLFPQIVDNQRMQDLFCVGSHHENLTVIFLVQNLFVRGKVMRTISLNCHYFILLKNRRDVQQINTLARQIYPHNVKYFLSAYHASTSARFGYLIVDVNCHSKDLFRLRTNCFPSEFPTIYLPEK